MSKEMKREQTKLDLHEISVQSFVTALDNDEQNRVKGGTGGTEGPGTLVPVFC
jgi:hypothetical protein